MVNHLKGLFTFNELYERYKETKERKMTKLDPDQDPSVHQEVEKFFDDNPQELLKDGSRPRVLILSPNHGSFRGFVTNTLWINFYSGCL